MAPMDPPVVTAETTMKEYRQAYAEKRKAWMSPENRAELRKDFIEIVDVIIVPQSVDMKELNGSEEEMREKIEYLYANDGRPLNPKQTMPPSMIDNYGKDYALNARGIYYYNDFRPELVTVGREVWTPSLEGVDWEDPSEWSRRRRARIITEHNTDNETRHKSEYAWEADAWADVFSRMRNDPCLEVDKHDYYMEKPKTHPVLCTLTGESTFVNRIPDATFGLATFGKSTSGSAVQVDELSRERLEKLLLHRKCGLLADPKWGETDLVFPFAVYEAKGWSGDCREARRQACQAGACYLDMLDNLARTPGPVGSVKAYQTTKSHKYQVFALTSFGAHWHLLVGYQRPRLAEEHAGFDGFSKTVYVFQRIWSARVTNERAAWELLSLVDQIHNWAITEFRTFVTEHLKPWHKFCDNNYLLDWKSVYDVRPELKQLRTCREGEDLLLPSWVQLLNEQMQRKLQERAKRSLEGAIEEDCSRKGIERRAYECRCRCTKGKCSGSQETYNIKEYSRHLRKVHRYSKEELDGIREFVEEGDEMIKEMVNARERLLREGKDLRDGDNKRGFVEEKRLNDGPSEPSLACIAGSSKRLKVS